MGQYSIKEVESLCGVKAHTLRIWEQRYDFLKPQRTETNIRFYDDEQLKLILNISTLNRNGMRISKIASMEQDELCREVEKLSQINGEPNALMDAFTHALVDFDEARFEKTWSCAIMKFGFEKTFTELIFPLMVRAGVLWATGAVCSAQEHFISNLVRRKICVAIDSQFVEKTASSKKFVLFLPEGETHELVLLYAEYLLRKNNHDVTYIGNSLPFTDVSFISRSITPDYMVTCLSVPPNKMNLQEYINILAASFPKQKIVIGGKQVEVHKPELPSNVLHFSTVEDLASAMSV